MLICYHASMTSYFHVLCFTCVYCYTNILPSVWNQLFFFNLFADDQLNTFHLIEINSFNQVRLDVNQIQFDVTILVNSTEGSIVECNTLATDEEVNDCFQTLNTEFSLMNDNIVERIEEIYKLGTQVLRISEVSQQTFSAGNRQFVREITQTTQEELIDCIQSM